MNYRILPTMKRTTTSDGAFFTVNRTLTRQTIGSLENGRYNPSILLAFKLARYFGTTIEDIFIYEEDGT